MTTHDAVSQLEMTPDDVAALSPAARRERVIALTRYSRDLVARVTAEENAKTWRNRKSDDDTAALRSVVGTAVLYSGGNDSTTLAHMFRDTATCAIHANTTIGIERTREFVRETCAAWGLRLIEKTAPVSFRELVMEQGFPGPAHHWKMYQRLKERPLRMARKELITDGRRERVIFIAGRRRNESERRSDVPEVEYNTGAGNSVVWVSPLVYWTKLDLNTYREIHPDVPRNPVSDILHMSGECLCGAFAKPGELDEIRMWFPDVADEIQSLEKEVTDSGEMDPARCRWGLRGGKPSARAKVGMLCSSCVAPGADDDDDDDDNGEMTA